jgi:thiamine biosynthesis lipoprotein
VSAGGSTIYGLGAPPGRSGWEVAIRDPLNATRVARTVRLKDHALSVAGGSEKYFEVAGRRYSPHQDPRTGSPVQGVLGVAVLTNTGTDGDALDEPFSCWGPVRSRKLIQRNPSTEAFFFMPGPNRAGKMIHEAAR